MQSKIRSGDTIAAIATAPGEGAISIVRVSGEGAIDLGDRIFRGRTPLSDAAGQTVHHGYVHDKHGNQIDEVLLTVFRSPLSYTGENALEIGCHGGLVTPARVLRAVFDHGARQADPGEFTKRAFLNRKLDLSQAEAVADLISARSNRAQEQSLGQLQGSLRKRVDQLRAELLDICSLLEIDLDFSDEDISVVSASEIQKRLETCQSGLDRLLATYETGRIIRDGVRVVLAGPPNAGKSSLFNTLLEHDRSIVSEFPGTTRDYIEESISISGVLFLLIDTAGSRETCDSTEQMGVLRSRNLLKSSDIIVAVVDCMDPPSEDFWGPWLSGASSGRIVVASNKTDLKNGSSVGSANFSEFPGTREVHVSAKTGVGIQELKDALLSCVDGLGATEDLGVTITNTRHAQSLIRASKSLVEALYSVRSKLTNEFVALDVRAAVSAISEITGEITSEDVINSVFERFCVGK